MRVSTMRHYQPLTAKRNRNIFLRKNPRFPLEPLESHGHGLAVPLPIRTAQQNASLIVEPPIKDKEVIKKLHEKPKKSRKKIKNFWKMAQNFKIKTQSNKIHNKISHFQQNPMKNHRKNKKLPINANFRNKQPKSGNFEEIAPKKPIPDEK